MSVYLLRELITKHKDKLELLKKAQDVKTIKKKIPAPIWVYWGLLQSGKKEFYKNDIIQVIDKLIKDGLLKTKQTGTKLFKQRAISGVVFYDKSLSSSFKEQKPKGKTPTKTPTKTKAKVTKAKRRKIQNSLFFIKS